MLIFSIYVKSSDPTMATRTDYEISTISAKSTTHLDAKARITKTDK